MAFAPLRTLRGRLLVLALVVEAVMLAVLIANSLRLVRDNMGEQARSHAEQIAPVLIAALVAPMAQYDYATVQAVLDESQAVKGIEYLAVTDRSGRVAAVSGWSAGKPLPPPDSAFSIDTDEEPPLYDVVQPITLAGQKLGTLHFGLDLSPIIAARHSLLVQGFLIAGSELLLSAAVLTLFGLLITKRLSVLTRASAEVAEGAPSPEVPEGKDDIGRLGAAFNAMSRAVAERVAQLTQARDAMARMAADMEQEHARLEALLAAMEFGILFSGRDEEVVYANHAFLAQWHLEPTQCPRGLALARLFELMAPALPVGARAGEMLDGACGGREIEFADGRLLTLRRRQVLGAEGVVLGCLWLFADVTEERRFEQQLVEAKERAEAANIAKSRFLATMSHEIRTPMNGILGMAQMLLSAAMADEERLDCARTILSSGQTLLTLLNDILDLSKVESGRIELESRDFDPAALLEETRALFLGSARAKGLELECRWHGPARRYLGDIHRLRQMLANLVGNAIKFTGRGGVRIEATQAGAEGEQAVLEFAVIDTGIGVAEDKHELIFQPFSQADSSTIREFGGTGLGLSIVRRLAEVMGGEVGVESSPGQGSRFWFRIRAAGVAAPSGVPAAAPEAPAAARPLAGGDTVLVVEDNAINRKVVCGLLGKLGVAAAVAENGQQALDLLQARDDFALVLMDIQMPVMDGYTATALLRQREAAAGRPRLPIVALTADAFEEDRLRCLAAGMDDFLPKPVAFDALRAALARWLAGRGDAVSAPPGSRG